MINIGILLTCKIKGILSLSFSLSPIKRNEVFNLFDNETISCSYFGSMRGVDLKHGHSLGHAHHVPF